MQCIQKQKRVDLTIRSAVVVFYVGLCWNDFYLHRQYCTLFSYLLIFYKIY